jgi:uncharacterized C2H2 Zn-finger protein
MFLLESHELQALQRGQSITLQLADGTAFALGAVLASRNGASAPRAFTCVHCGHRAPSAQGLAVHMTRQHRALSGDVSCPQCRQVFGSRFALAAHIKGAHGPKRRRPFTAKQRAAVRRNLKKGRQALAARRRARQEATE